MQCQKVSAHTAGLPHRTGSLKGCPALLSQPGQCHNCAKAACEHESAACSSRDSSSSWSHPHLSTPWKCPDHPYPDPVGLAHRLCQQPHLCWPRLLPLQHGVGAPCHGCPDDVTTSYLEIQWNQEVPMPWCLTTFPLSIPAPFCCCHSNIKSCKRCSEDPSSCLTTTIN